jgi:hypothetical protein
MRSCGACERGRNGGAPGTADQETGHRNAAPMITLQFFITLAYYALTAGAAALLLYNFVKAKSWEREVLYLIVLVPFLLRVLRLK